jgi:opacity protein-like surface antigen
VRVYRGLSVTVHGGYDQFTLNKENLRLVSQSFSQGISQGNLSFLSGSLGLRYTYLNNSDAHPYVTTGIGIYRLTNSNRKTVERGEVVGERDDQTFTEMGMHLAIGSIFRLNDTYAVFFEPRYVFYDVQEELTGTLRYFTLRLGMDVQLN